MKLRNYLLVPTIIHIIVWLIFCAALYLLEGVSLPHGIGSVLVFLTLFISIIGYYLGAVLVLSMQIIGLIGSLYHAINHKGKLIPTPPDWLWQMANIGINTALLVLSPFHGLLTGWLSI